MKNTTHVKLVNQMWNTLDASHIENILSEDIEYISAWVLMSIKGKDKFLFYIRKKLRTISAAKDEGKIIIISQVVNIKGSDGEDFIELMYVIDGRRKEILIRVEVRNSLIESIQLFPKANEIVTIKI
jgi:hypothetical protein